MVARLDNLGTISTATTVGAHLDNLGGFGALGPPDPVTDVTAHPGNTHITVRWVAPLNPHGEAVTYYLITAETITQPPVSLSTMDTYIEFTNLQNGKSYTFTVVAVSNTGKHSTGVTVTAIPTAAIESVKLDTEYDFHFHTWDIRVGSNRVGPEYALRGSVKNRRLDLTLNAAPTFSFEISGLDPIAPLIHELASDVWVYCDGKLVYRGRITGSNDRDDGAGLPTTTFESSGYEALLDARELHTSPYHTTARFNPDWTPNGIIEWLIQHAENQKNMRLGLTRGQWLQNIPTLAVIYASTVAATDKPNVVVNDGDNIYTSILDVCKLTVPPIEFWVDADLTYNINWTRGVNRTTAAYQGYLLAPGMYSSFSRSFKSTDFANVIRATGSHPSGTTTAQLGLPSYYEKDGTGIPLNITHTMDGTPDIPAYTTTTYYAPDPITHITPPPTVTVVAEVPANPHDDSINTGVIPPSPYSVDPIGGWQKSVVSTHIYNQAGLDAFAKFAYSESTSADGSTTPLDDLYSYSVTLAPGYWQGKDSLWIGDTIMFYADKGRVNVRQAMRVQTLTINVDDTGVEQVTLGLNLAKNHELDLKRFRDAIKTLQKK